MLLERGKKDREGSVEERREGERAPPPLGLRFKNRSDPAEGT